MRKKNHPFPHPPSDPNTNWAILGMWQRNEGLIHWSSSCKIAKVLDQPKWIRFSKTTPLRGNSWYSLYSMHHSTEFHGILVHDPVFGDYQSTKHLICHGMRRMGWDKKRSEVTPKSQEFIGSPSSLPFFLRTCHHSATCSRIQEKQLAPVENTSGKHYSTEPPCNCFLNSTQRTPF